MMTDKGNVKIPTPDGHVWLTHRVYRPDEYGDQYETGCHIYVDGVDETILYLAKQLLGIDTPQSAPRLDPGEPAFTLNETETEYASFGLTKREYIAAQVASGVLSLAFARDNPSLYVTKVVEVTDALIAELNRGAEHE